MSEHGTEVREYPLVIEGTGGRTGYCLQCMRPLRKGASRCEVCGFVSTPSMRREYWNLDPNLLWLTKLLRAVILVGIVGHLIYVVVTIPENLYYRRALGLFVPWVPTVLVGVAAWHTVGKLTRWMPSFRAAILWSVPFLAAGVISLLVMIPIIYEGKLVGPGLIVCGGLFLCGGLILKFGSWAFRWRQRKIAAGSERGE